MEQLITQVKYVEKGEHSRKGSVLCTLTNENRHTWNCQVQKMSLTELAHFIIDFFNSKSVTAESLEFTLFKQTITVYKSSTEHNYKHYLEELCSRIVIE